MEKDPLLPGSSSGTNERDRIKLRRFYFFVAFALATSNLFVLSTWIKPYVSSKLHSVRTRSLPAPSPFTNAEPRLLAGSTRVVGHSLVDMS